MRQAGNDRRPAGALEADVLDVLWRADRPLTPGDVLAELGSSLAYTTIMTVLSRLHAKDAVSRERRGRAYAYAPVASEADHMAGQMHTVLEGTSDRALTLSRFVDALEPDEARALRRLLEESAR